MKKDGYIKFNCEHIKEPPMAWDKLRELNEYRQALYSRNLIGAFENKVGFGNISRRLSKTDMFIITGSATGNFSSLNQNHYVTVTSYHFNENHLTCRGPIKASSESLSHAAVYESDSSVNAVIHVHNKKMWNEYFDKLPTTSKDATYGTVEMADEIKSLFEHTDVSVRKIFVMGGHEDGIIAFGSTLEEAYEILINHFVD